MWRMLQWAGVRPSLNRRLGTSSGPDPARRLARAFCRTPGALETSHTTFPCDPVDKNTRRHQRAPKPSEQMWNVYAIYSSSWEKGQTVGQPTLGRRSPWIKLIRGRFRDRRCGIKEGVQVIPDAPLDGDCATSLLGNWGSGLLWYNVMLWNGAKNVKKKKLVHELYKVF